MGSGAFGMGVGLLDDIYGSHHRRLVESTDVAPPKFASAMPLADDVAAMTHSGFRTMSDIGVAGGRMFFARPTTRYFGLDLHSGLGLGASITQINNKQDMGIAKKFHYTPYHGNYYSAPGGDFHRKYPDVWAVYPALAPLVTVWQAPTDPICVFTERDLIVEFGKLECKAPAKCSAAQFNSHSCPKSRSLTKWSKSSRRLQGFEIETAKNTTDETVKRTIWAVPTIAHFDRTLADGNVYITTAGWIKPREVETAIEHTNGTITSSTPASTTLGTEQCTVTDTMIKEACGEEEFIPPPACPEADITCPALPNKFTAAGPMACTWDNTTTCAAHICANTTTPCLDADGTTCLARVLSNVTAGIFGRSELTCPAGSYACSPGELSTLGIDLSSGKVQPFYNQASYLTFGGKIGSGADPKKDVCTVTHEALQKQCGVQVCKTITFKKSGEVVDCDMVSVGPTDCRREVLPNGCPSNTCVDLQTSSCFDVNKDLQVDEQDAIILFTAGSVPKDFGGIELVEKYLKRDNVATVDDAATMHARVQQCRAGRQYSFTSGFREATDRFDFVALYIAVTLPKSFSGQSLLEDKIKSSFGFETAAEAADKYTSTIAAIKSKHIAIAE
jgi:hypothetical protein